MDGSVVNVKAEELSSKALEEMVAPAAFLFAFSQALSILYSIPLLLFSPASFLKVDRHIAIVRSFAMTGERPVAET